MLPSPALLLALALGLGCLQLGCGQPLRVDPPEPVVTVAMGASLQLVCSLTCQEGAQARVQWRGLDIDLGTVQSGGGSSVLSLQGAALSHAGTRVCVGSCGGPQFQHSVRILVYAFPDQLVVSPMPLVPGQDREVSCTARRVWPVGPDVLSFALLRGDQELRGVRALDLEQEEEEDVQEADDLLLRVTQRWLVPDLGTPMPPALHCQATMQLPGLELTRRGTLPVLQTWTYPEPPNTTSTEPRNLASPGPRETITTGSPDTTTLLSAPQWGSTLRTGILGSVGTCHPEIRQGQGADWELLCEAPCGPGVAVHWVLAPGGLAAYHKQEAGARAWLTMPSPGPIPVGLFRCRLDPGGQVASMYVPSQVFPKTSPDPDVVALPTALWIGSLVLVLLLMGSLVYCLGKRCRPPV